MGEDPKSRPEPGVRQPCPDSRLLRGSAWLRSRVDMGWIVTIASPSNPTAQISFAADGIRPHSDAPVLTVEVSDVDGVHAAALARGFDIVLSVRDEEWGVRRFFVRDPDGRVINVMSHPETSGET